MKRNTLLLAIALMMAAPLTTGCKDNAGSNGEATPKLATMVDTLSWAYGQNFAQVLQSPVFDTLDPELVIQAVRHTLADGKQPISEDETRQALEFLTMLQSTNMMQTRKTMRETVTQQQADYFAQLEASNPNVKRHSTGFYYEVLRQGHGPKARYADRIRFDYRSFIMLTGKPFDQTYGKREPIVHVVGSPMFPGLIEAFQLMNAGSIYRFYFPYQLAFGEEGSGEIPGYTPFIYEIELHEIYDK